MLKLLARTPLAILHALGALMGCLVYLFDRRYRQELGANLQQASHHGVAGDYRQLLRRSIAEQGKGALELFAAWGLPVERIARLIRDVRGRDVLERALADKRALIMVTPHLGGFEFGCRYISTLLTVPVTAMYRPPKLRWLEPLMQAGRARDVAKTAPATGAGVRQLMKALKNGEATVILPDQAPGAGEGVWAPFFGKPAYTMTLLPRIATATDAVVLFVLTERLSWGRGYILHIHAQDGAFTGDKLHDATVLNRNIEKLIALAPTQYLWSYKRYKQPAGAPAPEENA